MRKADNLPPSCAVVTKSGNLNFLEPSGSLRVSKGTALPFLVLLTIMPSTAYFSDPYKFLGFVTTLAPVTLQLQEALRV